MGTGAAAADAHQMVPSTVTGDDKLRRTLTANLPDTTMFLLDRDLRILITDGDAIGRLGWFDETVFQGRRVAELDGIVPAEILDHSLATYAAALDGERGAFDFSSCGLTFSVQAVPLRGDDGTVESVLVVARDTTRHTLAEQRIQQQVRQQKAVAELGHFALACHDLPALYAEALATAGATLDIGGGILELSDDGRHVTIAASVGIIHGDVGRSVPLAETRLEPPPLLLERGVVSSESVPIVVRGQPFAILDVHARQPRSFSEDEVAFLTAIATLVAVAVERHQDERDLRHVALHDPLTDLPNRALALSHLDHALKRRRREGIDVGVLALDIDRFKQINDTSGHAAGDEVLCAVAKRLVEAVRAVDTVARLSGDEFIIVCPDIAGPAGAVEIARRVAAALARAPALCRGGSTLTVSTGIALTDARLQTSEQLLRDADAAMYRAKDVGSGRYELFDDAMRARALTRSRTEADLRVAIAEGQLETYYQPVIDLATELPTSIEALVRWNHPDRGVMGPFDFIPFAEQVGLIGEIGRQVLEAACRQTETWQRDIDPQLGISVNVSGLQVMDPAFPAQVEAIVARSGVRRGTLALEITESVLMEESGATVAVLGSLRERALTLALDDFGTGYSSLSRLKHFPLDVLKIDRSFVAGVDSNEDDRAIVKATIDMAHAVGLTVVAEGVETHAQATLLRELGCDRAQGYLYARPQCAAATTEALRELRGLAPDHPNEGLTVGAPAVTVMG